MKIKMTHIHKKIISYCEDYPNVSRPWKNLGIAFCAPPPQIFSICTSFICILFSRGSRLSRRLDEKIRRNRSNLVGSDAGNPHKQARGPGNIDDQQQINWKKSNVQIFRRRLRGRTFECFRYKFIVLLIGGKNKKFILTFY